MSSTSEVKARADPAAMAEGMLLPVNLKASNNIVRQRSRARYRRSIWKLKKQNYEPDSKQIIRDVN